MLRTNPLEFGETAIAAPGREGVPGGEMGRFGPLYSRADSLSGGAGTSFGTDLVPDGPQGEAHQDRREVGVPWTMPWVPTGRAGGAAGIFAQILRSFVRLQHRGTHVTEGPPR